MIGPHHPVGVWAPPRVAGVAGVPPLPLAPPLPLPAALPLALPPPPILSIALRSPVATLWISSSLPATSAQPPRPGGLPRSRPAEPLPEDPAAAAVLVGVDDEGWDVWDPSRPYTAHQPSVSCTAAPSHSKRFAVQSEPLVAPELPR